MKANVNRKQLILAEQPLVVFSAGTQRKAVLLRLKNGEL